MARSYRIRPKEHKLDVVFTASFTNPATHVPDSAIAVVFGDNVPAHRVDAFNVSKKVLDEILLVKPSLSAGQYAKGTVPLSQASNVNIAVTSVAGTDTPGEGGITVYVGEAVNRTQHLYVREALKYALEVAIETGKAA